IEPLPGSDVPAAAAPNARDDVMIRVPESYSGSLNLSLNGDSKATVSDWTGGNITARLSDSSNLETGDLNDVSKVDISTNGTARAFVVALSTQQLVAHNNGSGQIELKHTSANSCQATVKGTGKIIVHGKVKDLKTSAEGGGSVQVTE